MGIRINRGGFRIVVLGRWKKMGGLYKYTCDLGIIRIEDKDNA